jgi:hypothetical protein
MFWENFGDGKRKGGTGIGKREDRGQRSGVVDTNEHPKATFPAQSIENQRGLYFKLHFVHSHNLK